jgi:hypothetical protein
LRLLSGSDYGLGLEVVVVVVLEFVAGEFVVVVVSFFSVAG